MTVCIECSLHKLNNIHELLETPINKTLLPMSTVDCALRLNSERYNFFGNMFYYAGHTYCTHVYIHAEMYSQKQPLSDSLDNYTTMSRSSM